MPETYLQTAYKDREIVKGLGARWDAARKQWYVPDGRDLAPFVTWLPAEYQAAKSALENAGTSVRATPCNEPSIKEIWVGRRLAGREAGSTAKPWF